MKPSDTWRVFIAVELPPEIRQQIAIHVEHLREAHSQAQASWTRPENIHLTLKFLGDTPLTLIDKLSKATSQSVVGLKPFKIEVTGAGAFPIRGGPRVLWIGLRDSQHKLGELHSRLEDECARVGFEKEARPFNPHLTIARLRIPHHARELATAHKEMEFSPLGFEVTEVRMIRSELSSEGSKYTTISRHPLWSAPSCRGF